MKFLHNKYDLFDREDMMAPTREAPTTYNILMWATKAALFTPSLSDDTDGRMMWTLYVKHVHAIMREGGKVVDIVVLNAALAKLVKAEVLVLPVRRSLKTEDEDWWLK